MFQIFTEDGKPAEGDVAYEHLWQASLTWREVPEGREVVEVDIVTGTPLRRCTAEECLEAARRAENASPR